MTAGRCLLCDRPRCDDGSPVMMQDDAFCYFVGGSNCDRFAIDWRARALAAEAQVCRLKTGEWIESDVLCQHHDMQHLAAINARDEWEKRALAAEDALARERSVALDIVADAQTGREYVRRAARRLWNAQDIARRALVEGLAECERLRGFLAAKLTQHERAIRADAAREERERVVAWLRGPTGPAPWPNRDIRRSVADAIERGEHAKGGE